MSSASEAVKFFLNKNWVTFALSLIAGFFTAVALVPAEWREAIPFENNDWKAISTIVVASAVYYVLFSIIHWGYKKISDKRYYSKIKKSNDEHDLMQNKIEIIHFIDCWNETDYQILMHLMNNGNKPIKTFLMFGTNIKPHWFKITPIKETPKPRRNDGEVRQEIYGSGAVKVSLKPEVYTFLKEILEEEGSLTSEYRPVFDFNEDSKETN